MNVVACVGLTLSVCLLQGEGSAIAADVPIAGKKFLLKSNPKMVLLSKDALVVPGAAGSFSDPRCVPDGGSGLGGSVELENATHSVTLSMPCANWSANGSGTLYKYKDAAGTPKIGKIKAGLLKVVSPGMGAFPVPNGASTVDATVRVGADKYCMILDGTGDGTKFLVKNAAATHCPECGNNWVDGNEACDGFDDDACPGNCLSTCRCALCGNNVLEGTEECDVTQDDACPGNCQANCTCPQVCGNEIQQGTEECDGIDAAACPGDCLSDCSCAAACPVSGGDSLACLSYAGANCKTCCDADPTCSLACNGAASAGCGLSVLNDACSLAANAAGCSAECCWCTGEVVGGFCWYMGAYGASCDATCAAQSLICDPATATYAGWPSGTLAQCDAVLDALTGPGTTTDAGSQPVGCSYSNSTGLRHRYVVNATTCAASTPINARACACE
jgi:hypothetical protein